MLKKLNLESFAELKYILQKDSSPKAFKKESSFTKVVQNYHTYIDQIFEKLNLTSVIKLLIKTNYPIILHDSHQMSSVYTVLLSDVRYIPVISNEHMLIPTVDGSRYSDFRYSQMLITPSILALEMLYLKLQLE